MKRIMLIVFLGILLTGCIGQKQDSQSDTINTAPVYTSQSTPTLLALSATFTPAYSTRTPSFTPPPTQTFVSTPTSDFQNVKHVIFTSAPPETCPPKTTSKITIPTSFPENNDEFEATITNILNIGGVDQLVRYLSGLSNSDFRYEDVTNDNVRELIIGNQTLGGSLSVFGCKNGEFIKLLTVGPAYEYPPNIIAAQDVNLDGAKELVVEFTTCHYCTGIKVYEWTGGKFESLVRSWQIDYSSKELVYQDIAELIGLTETKLIDIDNNGTFELVLGGGIPSYPGGWSGGDGPWRVQKAIYMWNGEYYGWYSQKFDAPNFRFEAIQDGDLETVRGDYNSALQSYQAAIFDDKLKSWTQEIWHDLLRKNQEAQSLRYPDIQKMPFNQEEYDQLSAYARYRIMLLHLKRGWESDARTVYETLIEKYPQGSSGYPYSQMATEFWNEFQVSRDLVLSCERAIIYAAKHEEMLDPLGDHGLFDEHYKPEDVCPFK
ncbi:MAG: hypothetical protein QM730_27690 [Anaerolineales bacterium]